MHVGFLRQMRTLTKLKVKGESSKLPYKEKKQECCSCVINQAVPHHGWEDLHLHKSSSSHLRIPLLPVLRDYKQWKLCVCKSLLQNALFGPQKYANYERKITLSISRNVLLFHHLWKLTKLFLLHVKLKINEKNPNHYNKQGWPTQWTPDLDTSQFAEGKTFLN